MERKNYHIDKQNIKRLNQESERTGIKKAEIVRRALNQYFKLKKENK